MPTPDEIYAALEARRTELGLSQAEVGARAFGKPDNSAFQALRRGSSPSADKLAALCSAVGWEFYYGPVREDVSAPATADPKEFASIPVHQASLAAGDGIENGTEHIIDYLAFRRDWLRKIGVSPANAVLARAEGDSMQPCIWDGDMLLIDKSRTEPPPQLAKDAKPRRAPVFALLDDGAAKVKRIQIAEAGMAILISDNPDYPPQFTKTETLTIIGKVLWWGHTNRG